MTKSERIVWLTGASSGIGADVCQNLLDSGARVVSFARRSPGIKSPNLHSVMVDLADMSATQAAVAETAKNYPATEVVHNAGATFERPLEEVSLTDLQNATNLHLATAIVLVQAALPHMRAAHYGRIVLISTRAIVGLEKRTVYAATKAGMIGMVRTWALELASDGITVNAVAPGPIEDTEMFHEVVPKNSELSERVAGRVPAGRLGRPRDVSRAICFFLSPESGFITGQTLFVCGGASVGNMSFT